MFQSFNDGGCTHCFTTRHGGVSKGPYSSLNMALHVGDNGDDVAANRAIACQALGINPAALVAGQQVHGDRVQVVTAAHRGRGAADYQDALAETDALVTNVPGLPLISCYADCVPLFFYDPVQRAVGLAHAGWRGTVLQIGRATVQTMIREYQCRPSNILAGIGPSIGPCCYEINHQVLAPLQKSFSEWPALVRQTGPDHWRLNLWEANRQGLLAAGIAAAHIAVAAVCTACHQDQYFSFRAEKGTTGRMASIIMLK